MTLRRLFVSGAGRALAACLLPALLFAAAVVPAAAQDASEFFLRLNRLENQVRELAGTVEKLEFENRRLQDQLRRFQEDVEFRFQESEGGGAPAQPPARQKRSDLTPAAPQADGRGAQPEITQTATPAVPASSISAQAVAPGAAAATWEAEGMEEAELAEGDEAAAEVRTARGTWEPGGEPVVAEAPALALPRIDTPAVIGQDVDGGAGRPLDLGAVAGAGRADPFQNPQSAAIVPAIDAATAGIPSVAATAPGDPQIGYRNAEASLRRQDYEAAEMGFREFLQSHPRDKLAPEATFHLGESYFFRGRYREAAEQYLKLTTTYSASALAPEGMLKLGMSLDALGARDQACATFSETARKFPSASTEVRQGIARARSRANCA
ncbi:tol-pal system protein YbgF [Pseudochelatococcus sp. B33]